MEEQLKDSSLSFDQLRKKLMDDVKDAKKEIKNLEIRLKELKKL